MSLRRRHPREICDFLW